MAGNRGGGGGLSSRSVPMPLAFTHAQTYELTYLDGPYIGDEHPDGHRAFAMKSHPDAVRCHCPPIPPPPPHST